MVIGAWTMKSNTCDCVHDDDGLHLCETAKICTGVEYYQHILRAFDLYVKPDKPTRAIKVECDEPTRWRAVCGCEIDLHTPGTESFWKYCGPLMGPSHVAQAVASVMREQPTPRPTFGEIEAAADTYYYDGSNYNMYALTKPSFIAGALWASTVWKPS